MSETRVIHVSDHVPGAVYIGRAMPRRALRRSPLANPFRIGPDGPRSQVLIRYSIHLQRSLADGDAAIVEALIACRGKPLACWCRRAGQPALSENACHGDVIADLLSRFSDDELRAMGTEESA